MRLTRTATGGHRTTDATHCINLTACLLSGSEVLDRLCILIFTQRDYLA